MALLIRNLETPKNTDMEFKDFLQQNDDTNTRVSDFLMNVKTLSDLKLEDAFFTSVLSTDIEKDDKVFTDLVSQNTTSVIREQIDTEGFVELVDWMGNDLSIVNAARVSYNRESSSFNEKDEKLLKFLWANHHTSPFRHTFLSFKVRLPIFVLRQWQKHEVGCAWKFDLNEQSGRYSELKHGYFRPDSWRIQDTKNKQSSHGSLSAEDNAKADALLDVAYFVADHVYKELLSMGIAKEQARFVLPLSTYTECIWTGSLQAIMHFLTLRTKPDAQYETRLYAQGIAKLTKEKFPKSMELVEEAIRSAQK